MAKVEVLVNEDITVLEEVQAARETLTFHQAARYGNVTILQKHLAKFRGRRKKLNKLDKLEFTALHYAVRYGHFNVIQVLINAGVNVSAVGADGAQPIHIASKYFKIEKHLTQSVSVEETVTSPTPSHHSIRHVLPGVDADLCALVDCNENAEENVDTNMETDNVITFLLKNGADVNALDQYMQSPLHYAACKGNTDAMNFLLNWPGIDINITDTAGGTPLHSACGNGHVEAVQILMRMGAELMVYDNEHENPFHFAAMSDKGAVLLKVMTAFIEQKGGMIGNWRLKDILNDQDNQGQSVLHLAVDLGRYDTCVVAISKGARVNLCRNNFATPLHLAATTGNLKIVKLLVSRGADLEAQNISQETPLHKAANFNRIEVIKYLLERGCNIDVNDQDSTTPLIMATYNGSPKAVETVRLLLDNKADISALDSSERSAIYWAAHENAYDVLKLLIEKLEEKPHLKYLIEQSDRFENTPLHIAAQKGFRQIVELLIDHNADADCCNDEELTPLHLAAINGNRKVITTLLTKQPDIINDEDESGNTALHLAALNGHAKIIDILIDFGAGVDPRNSLLWTPLDCAAVKGHNECVIRLLDRDAPIDPMDLAKTTPLHLASREGHADVVSTLLKNGADVTIVNHQGFNALNMAVENTHRDTALAILDHKDWKLAMKNRVRVGKGVTTPMRQLVRKLPDVAFVVLNKCMKLSENLPHDSEDFQVRFYYDFVDDTYADWSNEYEEGESQSLATAVSNSSTSSNEQLYNANKLTVPVRDIMEKKENHPLVIMCDNKAGNLLSHPLCLSLMYLKWQLFGRVVFYFKFLLYFIFIFFFTGFVLVSTPLHPRAEVKEGNTTCVVRATKADKEKVVVVVFFLVGRIVVLVFAFLQLVLEIPQLVTRRLAYLADLANILEWVIYILSIVYAWPDFDHMTTPHEVNDLDCVRHVTVGSIAIFTAWINLLLFIRKFPTLGIYVVMFVDVTKTFLKFSITFILFVVAFALGFYTLLEDKFGLTHANIGRSIVKTLVMMIGEFDFDSLFNGGEVHPPVVTWILFVIFVIIMTILLMNLMVGLAVDDIKLVLDQAALTRISMQLNLVLDVEKSLPRRLRQKFMSKNMIVLPNKEFPWYMLALKSHITRMEEIEEALQPKKTVSDLVQEHTQAIHFSVEKLKVNSKVMSKQLKTMEHMMERLLKASNIDDDEDDEFNAD